MGNFDTDDNDAGEFLAPTLRLPNPDTVPRTIDNFESDARLSMAFVRFVLGKSMRDVELAFSDVPPVLERRLSRAIGWKMIIIRQNFLYLSRQKIIIL